MFSALYGNELINYTVREDSEPVLALTAKGRIVLTQASTITPRERTARACIDGLTRKVLAVAPESLYRASDAREAGLLEIPLPSLRKPTAADIPLEDFDKLLERRRVDGEPPGELLAIRRVDRAELCFMPCVMVFYRHRAKPLDVEVSFWRDDGQSHEHDAAFRIMGGAEMVGARFLAPSTSEVETATESDSATQTKRPQESGKQPAEEAPTLQAVLCHEHPALLKRALCLSQKRLLIISPWIRHQVVDAAFLRNLEALLKKRVEVFIGYGLDQDGPQGDPTKGKPPITPQAEKALKELTAKYKNFRLVYVGNTHRKLLVSDDNFAVSTSFNWLSFRGDPKERPRDEQGVLIRKKKYVEEHFQSGLTLLQEGYSGPATIKA